MRIKLRVRDVQQAGLERSAGTYSPGAARGREALRDRRGSTAVEFALIVPVMFLMIAGFVQYGTLLFTYTSMLNTARTAARELAVGSATASEAETKGKGKGKKPGWVGGAAWKVKASDTDVTGTDAVEAEITVDSESATVLPLLPMPEELSVTVVMEKES